MCQSGLHLHDLLLFCGWQLQSVAICWIQCVDGHQKKNIVCGTMIYQQSENFSMSPLLCDRCKAYHRCKYRHLPLQNSNWNVGWPHPVAGWLSNHVSSLYIFAPVSYNGAWVEFKTLQCRKVASRTSSNDNYLRSFFDMVKVMAGGSKSEVQRGQ